MKIYNTDSEQDRQALRQQSALPTYREVLPRNYEAKPVGSFTPAYVEQGPDMLVPRDQYKEALKEGHEYQTLPMYFEKDSWAPDGFRYNQNGLGYCWTWGGTAAVMTLRHIHGLETVPLAPVSMGYLVGWRNRGNYLESFIEGARKDGICPAINGINDHRNQSSLWPMDGERKLYRLEDVWDIDTRSGDTVAIQELLSCLYYGLPVYIAYNWWGHALEMTGLIWDESKWNNLIFVIRNSHNESEPIYLEGSKGVPDEMYAFGSLKLA